MAYKKVIQRTFGGIFYASSCVFIRFVFASCGFQSSNSDTRLFKSTQIRQFDELPRGVCHASAHPPTGSSFIKSRQTEREKRKQLEANNLICLLRKNEKKRKKKKRK